MINKNKTSLVAKNYANALVEISKQDNSFNQTKTLLYQIIDTIKSSKNLTLIMGNSAISYSNKIEIIDCIFKNKIDNKILNFLKILIEKNRFSEFESIVQAYDEMVDNFEKKISVEVVSSIELDPDIKGKVLNKLEQKLKCEIIPQWSIDESLIAGLMFKFGDFVIDTSVKSKLESLSKYMLR